MDFGTATFDELGSAMEDSLAYARAALDRADTGWILRTCDVVVGARPPGWREGHWEYERLALVAAAMPASALLAAMCGDGGRSLILGPFHTVVPASANVVNWRHQPSRALHDQPQLEWPTYVYELHPRDRGADPPTHGFVVGEGSPSFPDERSAIRAFLYGDFSTAGTHPGLPSELARLRVTQREAWIRSVRVTPSHIDLRILGDTFAGSSVEVNGSSFRRSKSVGKTGRVRIPLPVGLPDDAWLYLTRGKRWLDYRALGPRLFAGLDRGSLGVEIALPDDPVSRVQALIAAGEGPQLEFKSALPGMTDTEKRQLLKTVAAFANANGGTVVFGIDRDELSIVGIDESSERGGRDRLGDLIRRIVVPTPEFSVQPVELGGKLLLVLDVRPGVLKPYGIRLVQDKPIEFYARHGANTYPADQGELRAAVLTTDQGILRRASRPVPLG